MPQPLRNTPAILAPVAAISRDLADIARNPVAMMGGLLGMLLTSAALLAGLMVGGKAHAEDNETVEVEFLPGEILRKGPKLDPKDLPEKIIVADTVAAGRAAQDSVTSEDDKIEPLPEDTDPEDDEQQSTEIPDPKKKNVKKSTKNTDSNTPHKNTPPTLDELPGDPFAGPDGWSDMAKDGDPWATSVMGALNGIKPPSFAGIGKPGTFQFRITICPNGTIEQAQAKGSTGDPSYDAGIKNEIERVVIPKPPAHVAAQLKGKCKRIPYIFSYGSNRRVR